MISSATIIKQYFNAQSDYVSRFGGDEFIAFYQGDDFEHIAGLMSSSLSLNLLSNEEELPIHASLGISIYPTDGKQFDQLYILADEALYLSKDAGKNCYTFRNGSS